MRAYRTQSPQWLAWHEGEHGVLPTVRTDAEYLGYWPTGSYVVIGASRNTPTYFRFRCDSLDSLYVDNYLPAEDSSNTDLEFWAAGTDASLGATTFGVDQIGHNIMPVDPWNFRALAGIYVVEIRPITPGQQYQLRFRTRWLTNSEAKIVA